MATNKTPKNDGEINVYENADAKSTRYWEPNACAIFINGMNNAPSDHVDSALALSKLLTRPVVGVYNLSEGTGIDFLQCIGDKITWQMMITDRKAVLKLLGDPATAKKKVMDVLKRNAAAKPLYNLLSSTSSNLQIYAHSQGNLILSNVLTGMYLLNGPDSLKRFTVNSFGSPAMNWPPGFIHYKHGFTFDPVNWLAGFDTKMNISKVGVPTTADAMGIVSHGFLNYLQDDATFVVNRFRFGALRMTANMDEEGLADALIGMKTNMPRVRAVFERLYSAHWSDVDDVAELYMNRAENLPMILTAIKQDESLRKLLIKSLDELWTSKGDKRIIDLLGK